MDSNIKEILKKLISFNTIKDKQNKEIINYIETYLRKFGFRTEYKSKCLVMSNSNDCNVGFLGHTDTVSYSNDWTFNPFELSEKDEKLYGLGTCDMKGGIATILSSVSKYDFKNKGIKLFFTYDEEIGFSGIKELLDKKISFPEYMIIGEPTDNKIVNTSKGLLEFRIIFKGLSSHSSKPDEGVNAIEACIKFINDLKLYYETIRKKKVGSNYATMNIGVISGGRGTNIVPDKCEVLIDFRTVTKDQNESIIKKIDELIKEKNITYEIINKINPFSNKTGKVNMSNYITEASFIDVKEKIILGVGPINAHKTNEYITEASLKELEKQYLKIIEQKCK